MTTDFRVQTSCNDVESMVAAISQAVDAGRWTLPAHTRFQPDTAVSFAIDFEDGSTGFLGRGICVASYPAAHDAYEVVIGQVVPEDGYENVLSLITSATSNWVDDNEIEDALPSNRPPATFLLRPSHPKRTHPFRDLFEGLPAPETAHHSGADTHRSEVQLELPNLPPRPSEPRSRPLVNPEHLRASVQPPATRIASHRPSHDTLSDQELELLE